MRQLSTIEIDRVQLLTENAVEFCLILFNRTNRNGFVEVNYGRDGFGSRLFEKDVNS
jgi:hypothetical protein